MRLSRILEPTRVEVETNKFECCSLSFSKGKEVGEEREKVILQQSSSKHFGSISILHLVPVALFFGSSTACLDKEI
jgi:hypothetical protein